MKKIKYIIGTFMCWFNRSFHLYRSCVRFIDYKMDGINNCITVSFSSLRHETIEIQGNDNEINIIGGSALAYGKILIVGDNNHIQINGSKGILEIVLRGNGQIINIGNGTTMESAYMVSMGSNNSIEVGENCMFSGDVEVWNTDSHLIVDSISNKPLNPSRPVIIGNHVWVGKHVKILKGCKIGDGSVIGMSSVVTKDVPVNSVATGNPAKVVKNNIKWKHGFINT